jgi:hypothetical protein
MTISVLQETAVDNAASAQTTIVATLAGATAGSSIHAIVITNHNYGISTVNDGVNGALTLRGTAADDATSSRKVLEYTIDNVSAGSHTVTATTTFSVSAPGTLVLREIGGTSGFNATANGDVQASPGTGTDGVVSNAATNTVANALISALSFDTNTGSSAPAFGTGFTNGQTAGLASLGGHFRTESKRITATGSNTATYTAVGGTDTYLTVMAIFAETAIAAASGQLLTLGAG